MNEERTMGRTDLLPIAKRWSSMAIALVFLPAISVAQAQVRPGDIEGLRLWLKADAGVTTEDNSGHDGTANDVKSWGDQSGKGNDVSNTNSDRSTRPELIARVPALGGKPAIEFDGKGRENFTVTESLLGKIGSPFDLNKATYFMVTQWDKTTSMAPLTMGPSANAATGRGGVGMRRGKNGNGWYLQEKYGLKGAFVKPIVPKDTDGDGMFDGFEEQYAFLDPTRPGDADTDHDADGLSNLREYKLKTAPDDIDSDDDGLTDGAEVNELKTDPLKRDTDGDGVADNEEIAKLRTDPLDRTRQHGRR